MTSHAPIPDQAQDILEFPSPAKTLPFSGERFTPAADGLISHEHFHRYLSVLRYCEGKRVADIACGEGYGSWLLADVAQQVFGIDVDEQTVAHCQASYVRPNLRYQVGNATAIPLPDSSVDVVVSFETLEHMVEHDEFMDQIRRILVPGGLLIISTPDRDVYSATYSEPNHFHLRELDRREFEQYLGGRFRHVRLAGQRCLTSSLIAGLNENASNGKPEFFEQLEKRHFERSDQMPRAVYLIALASDAPLPPSDFSVLLDDGFLPDLHQRYRAELERVWGEANKRLAQVQALNETMRRADSQVDAYAKTVLALEQLTQLQAQSLRSSEQALASQSNEIAALRRENLQATAHHEQLQREHLAALQAMQLRIDGLVNSTSWRITRPLRWIKRRLSNVSGVVRSDASFAGRAVRILKSAQSYRSVRDSGLFSADWYLQQNPDVRAAGSNPLWHYLRSGSAEGRAAGPQFDASHYLRSYPDVARSGLVPIVHYVRHGRAEGREPVAQAAPAASAQSASVAATSYMALAAGQNALLDETQCAAALANMPSAASIVSGIPHDRPLPARWGGDRSFSYAPLISILLPTYNTEDRYLRQTVQSVLNQTYSHWELCIVDDGSTSEQLHACLDLIATWDSRIRIRRNPHNQGISGATNDALEMARGDFVAMLDHDDELLGDALSEMVVALNRDPNLDAIYTDQDYIEADGAQGELLVKPDWSPTLMCGVMFVGHLLMVRRTIAVQVGGFDARFNNVQDFEFMLRVSEATNRICHVAKVLYHWRRIPGSVALHGNAKANIEQLQAEAVTAHLQRKGLPMRAVPHAVYGHRATLEPNRSWPELSVPAIFFDSHTKVRSSPNWPAQLQPTLVVTAAGESNITELDQLLRSAQAQYVLVGNVASLPSSNMWLDHMLAHLHDPQVALVSALIVDSHDNVVEAGTIIAAGQSPLPALRGRNAGDDGYAGSLACAREVSAVAGDCVLINRDHYLKLGGLNRQFATLRFAWIDYSLRASQSGLRNIVAPPVKAVVTSPAEPGALKETYFDSLLFDEIWRDRIAEHDPYHNRHLGLHDGGYQTSGPRVAKAIAA